MWPIIFESGTFQLGSYGVILVLAVFAALWVSSRLGKRDGLPTGPMIDIGVISLFAGIIGSKSLGILVSLANGIPLEWSELRNAGAVHGGLLAGIASLLFLLRRFQLPFRGVVDAFAPAIALGQAIGRVGCLMAGCCFGEETELPWAVSYTQGAAFTLGGAPLHTHVHPVQLYDAGAHIFLFLVLGIMHRKSILRGKLFGLWCILEGFTRIIVESYRGDLGRGIWWGIDWLSTGRLTALSIILIGLLFLGLSSNIAPLPPLKVEKE
ncbi:MAG: prolipoprotein diacylglyceryl transferase [Polyangiaceae bacterium]|nr:prolipoprotein diacylglyceryl transferase [Polyangiaceae bacterium]